MSSFMKSGLLPTKIIAGKALRSVPKYIFNGAITILLLLSLSGCFSADPFKGTSQDPDKSRSTENAAKLGSSISSKDSSASTIVSELGSSTTVPQNWRSYENNYFQMRFSYPTDIFQLSEGSQSINLGSPYLITDDAFGDQKNGTATYAFRFDMITKDVVSAVASISPDIAIKMFPDGSESSFKKQEDMGIMMIDGLTSYSYLTSEAGAHRCRIFVPRGPNATIAITYDFGSSKELPDRTQSDIFKVIARSITFI